MHCIQLGTGHIWSLYLLWYLLVPQIYTAPVRLCKYFDTLRADHYLLWENSRCKAWQLKFYLREVLFLLVMVWWARMVKWWCRWCGVPPERFFSKWKIPWIGLKSMVVAEKRTEMGEIPKKRSFQMSAQLGRVIQPSSDQQRHHSSRFEVGSYIVLFLKCWMKYDRLFEGCTVCIDLSSSPMLRFS